MRARLPFPAPLRRGQGAGARERAAGIGRLAPRRHVLLPGQQVRPDDHFWRRRGKRVPAGGHRGRTARGFRLRTSLTSGRPGRPRQPAPSPVQGLRGRTLRRRRRASASRRLGIRVGLEGWSSPSPKGEEGGSLLRPPPLLLHCSFGSTSRRLRGSATWRSPTRAIGIQLGINCWL